MMGKIDIPGKIQPMLLRIWIVWEEPVDGCIDESDVSSGDLESCTGGGMIMVADEFQVDCGGGISEGVAGGLLTGGGGIFELVADEVLVDCGGGIIEGVAGELLAVCGGGIIDGVFGKLLADCGGGSAEWAAGEFGGILNVVCELVADCGGGIIAEVDILRVPAGAELLLSVF